MNKKISREFIKNQIGSIVILVLGWYCSIKVFIANKNTQFNPTWQTITTTKDLN
jgi:hypothetical protein